MKPVDQTILHDPENGKHGDCMRACVASVLELPIEEVPHFTDGDREDWIKGYLRFLHDHEWLLYGRGGIGGPHPEIGKDECPYYFAIGPSPRKGSHNHMVVCHKGEVVHDPHPDKTFLDDITVFEILLRP